MSAAQPRFEPFSTLAVVTADELTALLLGARKMVKASSYSRQRATRRSCTSLTAFSSSSGVDPSTAVSLLAIGSGIFWCLLVVQAALHLTKSSRTAADLSRRTALALTQECVKFGRQTWTFHSLCTESDNDHHIHTVQHVRTSKCLLLYVHLTTLLIADFVLLAYRDVVGEDRSRLAVHLLLVEDQVAAAVVEAVVLVVEVEAAEEEAVHPHQATAPTLPPNDPRKILSSTSTSTWTRRSVSNLLVDEKVRATRFRWLPGPHLLNSY